MSHTLPTAVKASVAPSWSGLATGAAAAWGFSRLVFAGQWNLVALFGLSAILLGIFTVLIRGMLRRGRKSAPELMARTVMFWWMLALFVIALTTHPAVTFVLIAAVSLGAFHEFMGFNGGFHGALSSQLRNWIYATVTASTVLALAFAYRSDFAAFSAACFVPLVLGVPVIFILLQQLENAASLFGTLVIGVLFFVFALGHAGFLLQIGPEPLLVCVLLTELRDLASYWIGKFLARAHARNPGSALLALGNVKIAEKVSPNKTWATGILAAAVTVLLAFASNPTLAATGQGLPPGRLFLWGVAIGLFGLMGDLVFSLFKRDAGLKDSVLIDRIDSLTLTIPASVHLLYWMNR